MKADYVKILEERRRPKCLHPGNGCWFVDSNGRCANAHEVQRGLGICKVNAWGRAPRNMPESERDTWRKEHGL